MPSIFHRKGRPGFTLQYKRNGRWHQTQFPTRAQALEERARVEAEMRSEEGLATDVTLGEYAVTWFTRIKPTIRVGTAKLYAWALDTHIVPEFGEVYMRDIRPAQIKDFLAKKLRLPGSHQGLAKKTVANIRSALHALLEEACSDGILATNPATFRGRSRLRLTPTKAERAAKIRAMDREQLNAFLEACRDARPERWTMFRLMSRTGLRLGETLGLQRGDMDYHGRRIHVRRGYTASRIEPTKSGAERWVDVPTSVLEDVRRWDRRKKADGLEDGAPPSPWLFPSRAGTPIDHNYIERDFAAVLAAAGLPGHFTPHSLRHTYATTQLVMGKSIYYVQKQLGHATIQQTVDLYGSWLPHGNQKHADELERYFARVKKRRNENTSTSKQVSKLSVNGQHKEQKRGKLRLVSR